MTPAGQLVGCELLTRFHCEELPVLNSKYYIMAMDAEGKRELLTRQLQAIEVHASWFRDNRLFCTVNVDTVQARLCVFDREIIELLDKLDFIRLEISENFEGLEMGINHPVLKTLLNVGYRLFLDDLGSGNANVAALATGCYEAVKLDRAFYRQSSRGTETNIQYTDEEHNEVLPLCNRRGSRATPRANSITRCWSNGGSRLSIPFSTVRQDTQPYLAR